MRRFLLILTFVIASALLVSCATYLTFGPRDAGYFARHLSAEDVKLSPAGAGLKGPAAELRKLELDAFPALFPYAEEEARSGGPDTRYRGLTVHLLEQFLVWKRDPSAAEQQQLDALRPQLLSFLDACLRSGDPSLTPRACESLWYLRDLRGLELALDHFGRCVRAAPPSQETTPHSVDAAARVLGALRVELGPELTGDGAPWSFNRAMAPLHPWDRAGAEALHAELVVWLDQQRAALPTQIHWD